MKSEFWKSRQPSPTKKEARSKERRKENVNGRQHKIPGSFVIYGIACISYIIASYWRLFRGDRNALFCSFHTYKLLQRKG